MDLILSLIIVLALAPVCRAMQRAGPDSTVAFAFLPAVLGVLAVFVLRALLAPVGFWLLSGAADVGDATAPLRRIGGIGTALIVAFAPFAVAIRSVKRRLSAARVVLLTLAAGLLDGGVGLFVLLTYAP